MATTAYGVNNALAVKLWAKKLFVEALKATRYAQFKGQSSTDSLVSLRTEMQKSAGDRVTIGLRMQLTGNGIQGDNTLEGNEEQLLTYSDNLFIDQLRHAVRSAGKMSEQRVPFEVREEAKAGLADWWSDRMDMSLFNQLAGATLQQTGPNGTTTTTVSNLFTGMQAPIAPTALTGLIICDGSSATPGVSTTEGSLCLTTTFALSLADIDRAVARGKTSSPAIRPLKINGDNMYVCFIHPWQTVQLRKNTTAGQWQAVQQAMLQGGKIADNPIITGALGSYNNTLLIEDARVPPVSNAVTSSTSYRRGIFCGAQAAAIAFGGDNGDQAMNWVEKTFDFGNQLGVSAGLIWGLKKLVYNSSDFATIVMSGYAPTS